MLPMALLGLLPTVIDLFKNPSKENVLNAGLEAFKTVTGVSTTPSNIESDISKLPESQQAKVIELMMKREDIKITIEQEHTKRIQAVNQTMQTEGKSEHWMQWSWRPFVGYIFGFTFFGCYLVLPLLKIPVPLIPSEAWMMIGAVLGVASWHRGAQKRGV